MKLISFTNDTTHFVQVDDVDFEMLSMIKWRLSNERGYLYATHSTLGKMHRFILGVTDPKIFVDHKDGNGMNCQRDNIRIATPQQNCCNTKVHKDSTTGYKGVYYSKKTHRYTAKITHKGTQILLGTYLTAYQAMLAYNEKAKELNGEFAGLNVPTFEDQFKCYLRGETNICPIRPDKVIEPPDPTRTTLIKVRVNVSKIKEI